MTEEERKQKNIEYQKKTKYKLSSEQYRELVESNKTCQICGYEFSKSNKLFIDHDHITGKVRGCLCHKCNILLRMAKDSSELLNKAIEYLNNNLST